LAQLGKGQDADQLEAYRGLMWSHPWLAGAFTLLLLSLAGLPPTMGFIAEVYVMTSGVEMRLTLPLTALVIGSVIGLYYYLRIIVVLLSPVPGAAQPLVIRNFPRTGGITLAALIVLVIWLGIYPMPLISTIQQTTAGLVSYRANFHAASAPHGFASLGSPRSNQ
jgi:NADH-quinone oxidoreductase subunit N